MIRVANSPCSWGVVEFDSRASRLACTQVLDEIASSGYEGTELGDWGFMPSDPVVLRDQLRRRHLALVGAFVPVALVDPAAQATGERRAVQTAELLAAVSDTQPLVVLSDDNGKIDARVRHAGRISPAEALDERQWDLFAPGAERIARAVRDATGLRTVFHAHCAGYVETPEEIDALMTRTDPLLLGFCLDTGHALYGCGNPTEIVGRYAPRLWHVHFKDCDPRVAERARSDDWDYFTAVRHGLFCELGRGSVDFLGLVEELRRRAYSGWIVVEQDVIPGMSRATPAASAQRNREFLRSLGL